MKMSWRTHEQVVNKNEQTPWSLVINKVNKNYGTSPLYHLSRGGWVPGVHILLLFTGLNQFIPFKTSWGNFGPNIFSYFTIGWKLYTGNWSKILLCFAKVDSLQNTWKKQELSDYRFLSTLGKDNKFLTTTFERLKTKQLPLIPATILGSTMCCCSFLWLRAVVMFSDFQNKNKTTIFVKTVVWSSKLMICEWSWMMEKNKVKSRSLLLEYS